MNDRFTGIVIFCEETLFLNNYDFRQALGEEIILSGPYLPSVHFIRTHKAEECIEYLKEKGATILARIEYGGYVVERTYQETKYKGEVIHD